MLKELSLLKWQEIAAKLASADNATQIKETETNVSNLEENLKSDRYISQQLDFVIHFT